MLVKIIDYDHQGRGIAKVDSKVVFIPKAKLGEEVSIKLVKDKKNYSIGKRCEPLKVKYCPYYQTCGGCQIGHLTYDEQLEFKKNTVKNIFSKYTNYNLDSLEIIPTKCYNYRNKVTFHIKEDKLGYYEEETNNLISIDKCNLLDSDIITLTASLNSFIKVHKKLTKAIIKSLDGKLMLILEGKEDKESINKFFSSTVSSLYYNNELISGVPTLIIDVLSKKFMVRKDSFFQVNKEGVSLIYQEVINLVKELDCNIIYDLYCGTGTISLLVSNYAKKVVGIEVVEDAVRDAKSNLKLNNITNTEFYLGDVSKVIKKLDYTPDTIILDPPRSGISKDLIEFLLSLKVKNIIYVSCNPLTLARDINLLDSIYHLESIKLVDEFPNTYHLESITLLNLRKKK